MNTENMRKLADVIEGLEHETDLWTKKEKAFCLNYLSYDCGTPSCIAGWAAALSIGSNVLPRSLNVERVATDWLGLPYGWAIEHLFYPSSFVGDSYDEVEPRTAAHVLRSMADVGDVEQLDDDQVHAMWNGNIELGGKE